MKIGVMLAGVNPKFWVAASQEAEQAGFESVWVPEHLVLPVKMSGSPHTGHDHAADPAEHARLRRVGLIALAGGVARTTIVRLGTHVYNIGLRHPFVTARAVATLDVFSGGRVEFGIGASWLEEEWDAMARLPHARSAGRRGHRDLPAALVRGRRGAPRRVLRLRAGDVQPEAVQQPIPICSSAATRAAALRRTANIGDGWIPMNTPVDILRPQVAE